VAGAIESILIDYGQLGVPVVTKAKPPTNMAAIFLFTEVIFTMVENALILSGTLAVDFNNSCKRRSKSPKAAGWNHDGIATPSHVFGDFQEPPTMIFLQIEKEKFPVYHKFL
jgi:hypothetical protein